MAKRELIETREIVYVNAPISPILQGDSVHYEDIAFKAQIGRIRTFSEQEIVKPYLDKIRTEIENLPTTKCTETRRIYIDADVFKVNALAILDKYKAESEDKR